MKAHVSSSGEVDNLLSTVSKFYVSEMNSGVDHPTGVAKTLVACVTT